MSYTIACLLENTTENGILRFNKLLHLWITLPNSKLSIAAIFVTTHEDNKSTESRIKSAPTWATDYII